MQVNPGKKPTDTTPKVPPRYRLREQTTRVSPPSAALAKEGRDLPHSRLTLSKDAESSQGGSAAC